ncbi:MAPEG family protein [Flagellatimonas centrodinii]|uniref:MAPEG family protein n=1 Tax=Flagellatimonas centrodinii TaxID=2806210 RepID=UPI001FEDEDC2|nr:MAPEG family protein [Flagellatimonas centrodinii]ULQ48140.1 MAPEG family protein [Flagellatimonas centrodinii]
MLTAHAMLQPVVALVLWSMVMWLWMYVTRIPAIQASRMKLDPELPNGQQMSTLPARVRWKADNYNHLMEQPTIFYAAALVLAVVGDASQVSLGLAWAYVGLRVVHSVFQATVNKIEVRFAIFALSSLVMAALAVRAAMQVF